LKKGTTAHNRPVYASPPVGGSGYGFARSIATLIPTQNLRHSLSALVFATQSPYSGRQTVVNSRSVRRNKNWKFLKNVPHPCGTRKKLSKKRKNG
jgi:hypothetical protein